MLMTRIPKTIEEAFAETERVLVFGAHADDIAVTAGGTIALLTRAGKTVTFCVITDGSKGGRETDEKGKVLTETREMEQRAAAKVLHVSDVRFLGFVDGELENTPDVRRAIVKTIREVKPDTVLTWDPAAHQYDNLARYHRDHRVAGKAVYDSIYPAAGNSLYFPELRTAGFKPHTPKRVWFYEPEQANLAVDIAETIQKKIEAIGKHESQMPRLAEVEQFINEQALKTGKAHGIEHAETFRYLAFR